MSNPTEQCDACRTVRSSALLLAALGTWLRDGGPGIRHVTIVRDGPSVDVRLSSAQYAAGLGNGDTIPEALYKALAATRRKRDVYRGGWSPRDRCAPMPEGFEGCRCGCGPYDDVRCGRPDCPHGCRELLKLKPRM